MTINSLLFAMTVDKKIGLSSLRGTKQSQRNKATRSVQFVVEIASCLAMTINLLSFAMTVDKKKWPFVTARHEAVSTETKPLAMYSLL